MKAEVKSERDIFTAKFEDKESDSYTIYKSDGGDMVAWLFFDGNFNLSTEGNVELEPEDLIILCKLVDSLKIDFYLEYKP